MKYRITLTEEQLRVVNCALEEYFRLALNQWWDLSDRLCMNGVDFSKNNPEHDKIFERFLQRRDAVREVFACAGRIMWPCELPPKSDEQLISEDIWSAIRHQLYLDSGSTDTWRVDAHPSCQWGPEPLPVIEKVEDG